MPNFAAIFTGGGVKSDTDYGSVCGVSIVLKPQEWKKEKKHNLIDTNLLEPNTSFFRKRVDQKVGKAG